MKNTTIKEIAQILESSPYFDDVKQFLLEQSELDGSPAHTIKRIIESNYDSLDSGRKKDEPEFEKDVWFAWHKHRILVTEGVEKIMPKNVETFTLVTQGGRVAFIRKPIGRVLGMVMSKIGSLTKDPDYYEAGSIILRECLIWKEKGIDGDDDEIFSLKMACLGSTSIAETRIKKN